MATKKQIINDWQKIFPELKNKVQFHWTID